MWTLDKPFDHEGPYYRFAKAWSAVKPLQQPYPPIFFGGSSPGALAMGAEHCDVFALYGEPLAETAERIADFRQRAAAFGRVPRFNISFRPIIAPTEGQAWDKAHQALRDLEGANFTKGAQDKSAERMLAIAARGDTHDERLWMPIAAATGAKGNTSAWWARRGRWPTRCRVLPPGCRLLLIGASSGRRHDRVRRELIPMLKEGEVRIDARRCRHEKRRVRADHPAARAPGHFDDRRQFDLTAACGALRSRVRHAPSPRRAPAGLSVATGPDGRRWISDAAPACPRRPWPWSRNELSGSNRIVRCWRTAAAWRPRRFFAWVVPRRCLFRRAHSTS
jgi:hypothetical protein